MNMIPEIVTERLNLRGFVRKDAKDVFNYTSDTEVLLHTTGKTPNSIDDSLKFVDSLLANPPGAYAWAIRLKTAPQVIGAVEFGLGDGKTGSIHYALAKKLWNRGLMTEACKAVLDWAFLSHPDLERVTTSALTVNKGSNRVMEKCGMEFQKTIKEKWDKFDQPVTIDVYSINRKQWERSR